MADERARERTAEEKMPEKIKALFDVAVQAGFAAAKREPNGSWRFIATKGDNEVWLTVNPDGSKIDRLQVTDLKTKEVISHDGETVERWVDLLDGAGINAKVGTGAYLKIEPVKPEFYVQESKLKGIGITFQEESRGKFQPTTLGLIDVT